MARGKFIVVDGIEGCGKSTVVDDWKAYLESQGKKVFDLKHYWKEHNRHPEFSELARADYLFTAEPTYTGIGKVIREELTRSDTDYPSIAIAEAYALDRLILYKKFYLQALEQGISVISDRSVSTSLVYQTVADPDLSYADIANVPGNAFALAHHPDHLILFMIDPEVAFERMRRRLHKQDNVIFEKLDFQTRAAAAFASPEYQNIFRSRGTAIHTLSSAEEIVIVQAHSRELLKHILSL